MGLSWGKGPTPQGLIVAANPQTNNLTITTTEAIVMSTPAFLASPGRYYVARTSNLHWQSTVATDVLQWNLRLAQNGAAAAVSNPRVAAVPAVAHVANAARGDAQWLQYLGNNLSGLCIFTLTVYRILGSGTCTTSSANLRPRHLWVEDRGT